MKINPMKKINTLFNTSFTAQVTDSCKRLTIMNLFVLFVITLFATQSSGQITRTQIMNNAVPFTSYTFTAGSSNIWSKSCSAVGNVTTPSWVKVGANTSMAYCWGGFSTQASFTTGLTHGLSAGDNDCTTSGDGSESCSLGVDCSGFVSRCWALSTKYSTSTLPNISTAYSSATMVQPGDIFNYAGSHVRLVETNYANGSYRVIEASANGWDVAYHTYTASQLTSYVPRWYIHVATVTGINALSTAQSPVKLFPNPSNGQISLSIQNNSADLIEIYSLLGEKIYEQKIFNDQTDMDLSREAKGMYLYHLIAKGELVASGKFLIQ
jgi:hypothetical protein